MSEHRSLRRALLGALCLLLIAALGGCGSDEDKGAQGDAGTSATAAATDAMQPVPEPPLSPEERARAERTLDFHNAAMNALEEGYYALPDALYANACFYLKTWQLPRSPVPAGSREAARARLQPEAGLFSEEETAKLVTALAGMDKALDALLGRYRSLESYVADSAIRDDGVKGTTLTRKLDEDHTAFMAARKTWMEIVEARAAEAETTLLREHPLQRQIQAAGAIFACFAQVARLLGAETDQAARGPVVTPAGLDATARGALERIHTTLENHIAEAAKPPFAAAPALERHYRAFLKETTAYATALKRGLGEGFFTPQRRELNMAVVRSRAAYNAFVRAANGARAR